MNAIQSLVVAAQLLGIDAAVPPKAVEPTPLFRLSLADVSAGQDAACRDLGPALVCAAYGTNYELWVKARVAGVWHAFPKSRLREGVVLPGGVPLSFEGGAIVVAGASVSEMELVRALYARARRVRLGVVDYAVLYEDGALVPASATFVRRSDRDEYFMAWRPARELLHYEWLLAVNGIMYGPRLEADALQFYSKPVPPIPDGAHGHYRFIEERPISR